MRDADQELHDQVVLFLQALAVEADSGKPLPDLPMGDGRHNIDVPGTSVLIPPQKNTRAPVLLVAEAGALRCARSGSVRSGTARSPRWTSSTRRPPPASRGRGS